MRSSEISIRIVRLAVTASLLAIGCAAPPGATQSSGSSSPDCPDSGAPQDSETVTTVRRAVEMGPLFIVVSRAGLASCRASREAGAITLQYAFRDGSSLHVTRNQATEYTDQELRLASPLGESPVAVLTRAEQASFDKGCGIDWRTAETRQPADEPGTTESIYRGDVCNCQARARSDASGRVVRLQLRSAC
jgi:hypothetical protein